jgi:peptidoglycan/xylan/chitin deacetylase (PgdA/CDA1 family)
MRFPLGKAKALTLSYDDAVEQDIRLIEIMNQYGLKGTFNLNSGCYAPEGTVYPPGTIHRRMSKDTATKVYSNSGHEVAVHGLTHPFLEQLPANVCSKEIGEDRANLEQQFNTIVRGMAYPFGTYSDSVVDTLKLNGIAYARTVISSGKFGIPKDWLRLEATCHHNDSRLESLTKQFVDETPNRAPWLFYLWGHSYEFESKNNWNVIENFAKTIGGKEDIWYATNIQIYDYVQAYQQLCFNTAMTKVYNPTITDLYFTYDSKPVMVPAGKEVDF